MAIDFEVTEHRPVAGPDLTLVKIQFRPSPGEDFHSNIFHMQLYPTGSRLVVTPQGHLVTESGIIVPPLSGLPDGLFPDKNPADPYRRETFTRPNDAEMVANIEAYWERKLKAAAEGHPYPQHHRSTVNLQVGASADDAFEADDGTGFITTGSVSRNDSDSSAGLRYNGGYRFTSVAIGQADTIDAATMQVWPISADDPNCDMYGNDVDDAANFNFEADVTDRVLTTANEIWSAANIGTGAFKTSPEMKAVIQEIINRGSWASGNALVTMFRGREDINRDFYVRGHDTNSAQAPKLDIDFTAAGGAGRRAQTSWFETEVPTPNRQAQASQAELETPLGPRQGQVSWAELETPSGPRTVQVSWWELETPLGARLTQTSWFELEVPLAPRQGQISWLEFEIPTSGDRGQVSWVALEVPTSNRQGQLSWFELETPLGPRRGGVSWTEVEAPIGPRVAQVSWTELETPFAPRRVRVSWVELETPPAPGSNRRARVSWMEFDLPPYVSSLSFPVIEPNKFPTSLNYGQLLIGTAAMRVNIKSSMVHDQGIVVYIAMDTLEVWLFDGTGWRRMMGGPEDAGTA